MTVKTKFSISPFSKKTGAKFEQINKYVSKLSSVSLKKSFLEEDMLFQQLRNTTQKYKEAKTIKLSWWISAICRAQINLMIKHWR